MTIEDSWVEIKGKLLAFIHEVDTFVAWCRSGREQLQRAVQVIAGAGAPPVEVMEPAPARPVEVPTGPVEWAEGRVPAAAWAAIDLAAQVCGLTPEVLAAIEVHETGWFGSPLFKTGNNPGGMKWYPKLFSGFGFSVTKYVAKDGLEYTSFGSWQEGISAHGYFLTQTRYDGVRQTIDPIEEIRVISEAGYAEGSPDWYTNVTALYRQLKAQRAGAEEWRPSKNFSAAEVEHTDQAEANTLPVQLRPNATWVAVHILEPVRAALGTQLGVESWYRSSAVNRAVGGSDDSQHRVALAVDLKGGRTAALWTAIRKSGILTDPMIRVLVEQDHYHVAQLRPNDPRDVSGGQWLSDTAPLPFEVIP